MSLQLLAHSDIPLTCFERVDRADIVQTTTSHKAVGRSICTGHHPAGPQGNGMDLGKERHWKLQIKTEFLLGGPLCTEHAYEEQWKSLCNTQIPAKKQQRQEQFPILQLQNLAAE